MLELIILAAIQGITEFLPISSSAHLIIFSRFFGSSSQNITLDISLHIGSLLAVIFFFKNEILNFLQNRSLFIKIILGSFPSIIAGFLLTKLNLIDQLRNMNVIALTTILFGILLYFSDRSKENKNISSDFTIKNSIYIGLMQIFALIPGVSRSGITITAARFLKFNRVESAKISFLLSMPILFAVGSYSFLKIIETKSLEITAQNTLAIVLSFIFSYTTLKFFIKFLKKFSLLFFMIYRLIFGIIIFFYVYSF